MIGDLTTLGNVKDWLNAGSSVAYPPGDDALLARLITSCSAFIQSFLSRSLIPATYVERVNGNNQPQMYLQNRPVVSVTSVVMDGTTIQPSNPAPTGFGWLNDEAQVYLNGWYFRRGFQNVTITYVGGYQTSWTGAIPSNGDRLPVSSFGPAWNSDRGVTVAGAAFTAITSGDSAVSQYKVVQETDGSYSYYFNAADAGQTAVVSFGYTPFDIEQVCIETVGEAYKRRSRIGQTTVNMGNNQVVSFSQKDFSDSSKTLLNQYRNVVPV
jgi:hypothetical protein